MLGSPGHSVEMQHFVDLEQASHFVDLDLLNGPVAILSQRWCRLMCTSSMPLCRHKRTYVCEKARKT